MLFSWFAGVVGLLVLVVVFVGLWVAWGVCVFDGNFDSFVGLCFVWFWYDAEPGVLWVYFYYGVVGL